MCASFKQEVVHKEIRELRAENGTIKSQWDKIANLARQHFVRLVGTPSEISKAALEEVLEAQIVCISEEASDSMEKKITLEELFHAASMMEKNKISGKDGLPIEFFLAFWEKMDLFC